MIELTTQCPQCNYCFDVSLPQLQQRKGIIRCAKCAHIFDAYECALEGSNPHPVSSAATNSTESAELPTYFVPHFRYHFIGDQPLGHGVVIAPVIQTRRGPISVQSLSSGNINSSQPLQRSAEASALSDIQVFLDQEDDLPPAESTEPIFISPRADFQSPQVATDRVFEGRSRLETSSSNPPQSAWSRLLWRSLFFVLTVILLLQLLYVYRAQIANSVAFSRPVLEQMCGLVDCEVPYMREIEAIEITQSSLQQQTRKSNQSDGYEYLLQLQMHNRLNWPQQWPTLVVSFSDAAAAMMATIAIPPEQYLTVAQSETAFSANATHRIRLPVWLKNKKINGFSIDKYYP